MSIPSGIGRHTSQAVFKDLKQEDLPDVITSIYLENDTRKIYEQMDEISGKIEECIPGKKDTGKQ